MNNTYYENFIDFQRDEFSPINWTEWETIEDGESFFEILSFVESEERFWLEWENQAEENEEEVELPF